MTVSGTYNVQCRKTNKNIIVGILILLWISNTAQLTVAGFVASPTRSIVHRRSSEGKRSNSQLPMMLYGDTFRPFRDGTRQARDSIESSNLWSKTMRKFGASSPTAIHEKANDDDDNDDMEDYGEKVASIFGNLRIPASLIAGAALGTAFSMPLADTDGLKAGAVKRIFTLASMGTLSSMLLTVLLSTTCMNDIALNPPRKAKYVKDYIEKNYALEWMLMKTHFMWGSVSFVLSAMLRGWVFLKCPIIGDGVLGIMGSLMLISVSILLEFTRNQTGETSIQQVRRNIGLVLDRTKTNRLFAVAALSWLATMIYVIAKIPYVYLQLTSP
eukprot:scaffold192_cov114-Cylindrotheca_fusiformis.AAC.2